MRFFMSGRIILMCFLCLFVLFSGAGQAGQKVPIGFSDYHGYTGAVRYIKEVAKAYPEITELVEIGRSTMERPIYVLVISNRKTGMTMDAYVKLRNMRQEGIKNVVPMKPYQAKPAQWIDGSMHGNEFTGTEVCLYITDKLVSGYGGNPEITDLIDTKTFYICPVINPDGVFNSVEKGISQRQNSQMKDDDGDGKVNEDGPDDLNGDGLLTQFRYKDPKGEHVIDDVEPRLMVRLREDEKTEKQRYSVVIEDKDNDGDGKRGEDSEAGIDVNRNFPEGWFTDDGLAGGQGDFSTSSPEARALAEFFANHRNILMAQNFHASGGFTYRPPGTAPDSAMHPRDIAVYDLVLGKKYLELIGAKIPEAWEKPEALEEFKAKLRGTSKNKYAHERGYEMPRGWTMGYHEDQSRRYGYGMVIDWMYQQYGALATTTELWNPSQNIKDFPQFEGEDARLQRERALLKYQDEKYGGKLFVPWKPFTHSELGEGEIGGWIPKYRSNALPGEPLLSVCETHCKFELFRAGLLPEVVISEVKARILYTSASAHEVKVSEQNQEVTVKKGGAKGKYKLVEVTAVIENKGKLATHVARGNQLVGNRQDVAWLIGDRDKITYIQGTPWQQLGVLDGSMKIPGYTEPPEGQQPEQPPRRLMPPGLPPELLLMMRQRQMEAKPRLEQKGPKREVKWVVAIQGETPLQVIMTSQKGGTKVKEVTVR